MILRKKQFILLIGILLVTAITFETFQQLFYIRRYQLANDVQFFDVLKNQSYRWVLWVILGISLFWFVKKNRETSFGKLQEYLKFGSFIVGLVLLNICIIGGIQLFISEGSFTFSLFWGEYFTFFFFQKAPIYLLGYSAVAVILHLYFKREALEFQVEELISLKNDHKAQYLELRKKITDKASILSIKVGNKKHIVPVEEIVWIEADDYCVKVHTQSGKIWTMRSSLKALEEKLGNPFLRVHRKAIANMEAVKEWKNNKLILSENLEIPIAKSQLRKVQNFYA
tara:strand:- start:127 stop:975 length:849 start_codon:yes stop_codon:yes gene_type:complete